MLPLLVSFTSENLYPKPIVVSKKLNDFLIEEMLIQNNTRVPSSGRKRQWTEISIDESNESAICQLSKQKFPASENISSLELSPFKRQKTDGNSNLLEISSPPTVIKEPSNVYIGEQVNGLPHGKGKITYSSGATYDGDFVNAFPHGKGKITYSNGATYNGDWINGLPHGKGKITYSSGATYNGDWINGKCHGKGKITHPDRAAAYDGDWINGVAHGKGKITYPNGAVYDGDWINGLPHGKGKKTFSNGVVYNGDWVNGKFQGIATT
jgi:hypothetical protein